MLVLYRTRIIKVTDRFRRTVIFATLGIMVLYRVSFVITLFGGERPVHQRAVGCSASGSACSSASSPR